jgi:Holliday junction resolvasome RuvABC ATP-dependent DNA helicase subunit
MDQARATVRAGFLGFIGNEPAVRRLSNDLIEALMREPSELRKSYLLTGPPSSGKTELARRIARVLGLPFVPLDGRALTGRERLVELLDRELEAGGPPRIGSSTYPPMVVLIDEAHLATRSAQEALLTALDREDASILLPRGRLNVAAVTFILATTRASDVDAALRTRCSEIQLRDYTLAEVAAIVRGKIDRDWPDPIYETIARLGREVPRIAIDIARELETQIAVSGIDQGLAEHLDDVRRARELDPDGVSPSDLDYLRILSESDRPMGEQALMNRMPGTDRARVTEEIEPYLVKLGFVRLGERGRELTPRGHRYLLDARLRSYR